MIIRFYAVDGDTYTGGDIDLSFRTYAEAKAAYDKLNAPFKMLRAFGDKFENGIAHQATIEYERFLDKNFFD